MTAASATAAFTPRPKNEYTLYEDLRVLHENLQVLQ